MSYAAALMNKGKKAAAPVPSAGAGAAAASMEEDEAAASIGSALFSTASKIVDASAKTSSASASSSAAPIDDGPADGGAGGALKPSFPAISAHAAAGGSDETRSIRVPPHRYTPLKDSWEGIVQPLVDHMKLQVRMNTKTRCVELKTSPYTVDTGALQKGEDFLKAFMLGFELNDAIALLRLDDLYVESFEVTDVKPLKGDHLSRAIGRIAGIGGKTRYAIENATRTRIVVADSKVHILGAFSNIQIARDAVCSLILGAPPGKVYNQMRTVASRIASKH